MCTYKWYFLEVLFLSFAKTHAFVLYSWQKHAKRQEMCWAVWNAKLRKYNGGRDKTTHVTHIAHQKRGNEQFAHFLNKKTVIKHTKKQDFRFFWANIFWANRSFPHLSWATWANCSRLIICLERPELFAHGCLFPLSDLSESLTVTHLSWAIWASRSQSLIWFEQNEQLSEWAMSKWANSLPCKRAMGEICSFSQVNRSFTHKKTSESLEKPMSEFPTLNILDWSCDLHSAHHYYVQGGLTCTLNDPCVLFVFSDPCP